MTDPLHLAFPLASLTGPIVDFCVNVIDDTGLAGIFLLMAAGSACIPVPSEAVMLFSGFNVSDGHQTLLGVTAAGMAGNMVGSWLAYAVGYYGRIDLLEKNKLFHVSPARLAMVDRFFKRHGDAAVFWCRVVPLARAFISLPAGIARMPLWRFTWLTFLGSLPWILGLAILGNAVGDQWDELRDKLQYVDYLVAIAIVLGVIYLIVRQRRGGGPGEGETEPAGASGS